VSLSSRANFLHTIAVGVVAGWASCAATVWAETNSGPLEAAPRVVAGDLSQKTDTELTALTAQWGKLSPSERRQLLAEVRGRMAANREARGRVGVQVQRRYGRVVRKSDGSVVVQTRVVRVRPRSDGAATGRVTFGIGFEQRSKSTQAATPPAVTVSQPPAADQTE